MAWIDPLLASASTRKIVWKLFYPLVTRRLARTKTVFLNYGFETLPPMAIPLSASDEPDRGCIQLYHQLATMGGRNFRGQDVLEVSCGHGGGASYLTRTFQPLSYTGLDLNSRGIGFCRKHHPLPGLRFVQGDAENLPFPDASFDAVLNVEASHCYPHFSRFLAEVARVLRPGGYFHYTDFRPTESLQDWDHHLASSAMETLLVRAINTEVLLGLERNAANYLALVEKHVPSFLRGLGNDFAALPGSRIHEGFRQDNLHYRAYLLRKK